MDMDIDEYPRQKTPRYREISANISPRNMLPENRKRTRKPKIDSYFQAYATTDLNPLGVVFSTISDATQHKPGKKHQSELPLAPKKWEELDTHPQGAQFKQAAQLEIETLRRKDTWIELENNEPRKTIPLKWVFTYKYDDEGFLLKHKARICARGDLLSKNNPMDSRATALAARSFRLMMALVAAFDLDTIQLDAVNAYLNANVPTNKGAIYVKYAPGFEHHGTILQLKKALYGLPPLGMLCQQDIIHRLKTIRFSQVCEDSCLFTDGTVIIFYYVDDFVIIARKEDRQYLEERRRQLKRMWEMRDLGELEWFLNIRIIRDRTNRKLWLSQDTYIDRIVDRFHKHDANRAKTPLPGGIDLTSKYDGTASVPTRLYY